MRVERSAKKEVTIHENIKSIDDFLKISAQVNEVVQEGGGELYLKIPDSISMPSSVIGLLLKLKNQNGVRIEISVGDHRLYELLDELNLVQELGVRHGN